jgi:hypothetical protein
MRYALFFATILLAPTCSYACSCIGPNPVCSEYWRSPVVFRGKVVERTLLSHTETTVRNLDGSTSTIHSPGFYRVRFSVLEAFRGELQEEITILTNEQSSACGFPFEEAGEYVVFAFSKEGSGELWTSKCSLTHKLQAGKEDADLTWMRALRSAPGGATIYGRLAPVQGLEESNLPVTVSVRGPEAREAVLDSNWQYTFTGLSPREYTVSALMAPGFVMADARKVTVTDKGCAQVDWPVHYDGHIRGRVTDGSGKPLDNIYMVLQRRDSHVPTGLAQVAVNQTDPNGRYDFLRVPPADYLVSANDLGPSPTRPYPRVYYPNADSETDAAGVHLGASTIVEDINISLPNAWKRVVVHTRVLQPDGSPATQAQVDARDIDYLWSVEPAMATAGPDGRAALTVYEGRTYYLTATISGGTQQRCAGPLKFTAKDSVILEPITIEHNWGNCLAQLNPNFRPPR